MQDLVPGGKAVFWALFLAFIGLAAVPSVVLIESARQYYDFLSGWDPGVLQATRLRHVMHRGGPESLPAPNIYFVEFRLRAPGAKQVLLAGDFNRWKPETLRLARKARGNWEIQVPLPPGRYRYLFQVDGAWTADPAASTTGLRDGRPTSVREVPPTK